MAVNGLSSKALLYAAHPGTAPPRTRVGSRKRGLLSALRKAGFISVEMLLVTAGLGDTPNALAVAVMRRRLRSFMVTRERDVSYITSVGKDLISNYEDERYVKIH